MRLLSIKILKQHLCLPHENDHRHWMYLSCQKFCSSNTLFIMSNTQWNQHKCSVREAIQCQQHTTNAIQNEPMRKWSMSTALKEFLYSHLPYIINHCKRLGYFIPFYTKNDYTSSRFLLIRWPSVKVKVIHTCIRMQSLVISIIILSLKEINS